MVGVVRDAAAGTANLRRVVDQRAATGLVQHGHRDAAEVQEIYPGRLWEQTVTVECATERTLAPLVGERALALGVDLHPVPTDLCAGHPSQMRHIDPFRTTQRDQRVAGTVVPDRARQRDAKLRRLARQIDSGVQRIAPEPRTRRAGRSFEQLDQRFPHDEDVRHAGSDLARRDAASASRPIWSQDPPRIRSRGQTQLPPIANTAPRTR